MRAMLRERGAGITTAVACWVVLLSALSACGGGAPSSQVASPSPAASTEAHLQTLIHDYAAKIDAEAASAPCQTSSNPWDYAKYCPTLKRLEALGRPALPYIATEIDTRADDGLGAYLLAIAGHEIWGRHATPLAPGAMSWESGKQWAHQYLDWARSRPASD